MQLLDAIAVLLVLAAVAAFGLGGLALSRANDIDAFYWLVVGVVGVRAAVQMVRPGVGA